jgi:hypothetical protein
MNAALLIWLAILAAIYFGPTACSKQALRLTDGTVWADDYRVEDWRTVC